MDSFTKQGYEEFTISVDFSENMQDDETIVSGVVTAIDNADADMSSEESGVVKPSTLTIVGQTVTILARSGTVDKSAYKITFRIVTSVDHKWEHDIKMKIKEI